MFSPCYFGHLCWEISCWCTWEKIPWTFPVRKVAWIWGLNKSVPIKHTIFLPFSHPFKHTSSWCIHFHTVSLTERESGNSLQKHNSRWETSVRAWSQLSVELNNLGILSYQEEFSVCSAPVLRGSSLPASQLKPEGVRKAAAWELDFKGECVTMSICKYLIPNGICGGHWSQKPSSWWFLLQNAQKFLLSIFSSRNCPFLPIFISLLP